MLRSYCFAAMVASLLIMSPCEAEGQDSMITKAQLQQMFDSIEEGTDWDLSKELVWGYFFTDSNKEVLEKAKDKLKKIGFDIVDIFLADKESPQEADLWWLHIEKIEHHTVESLFSRNSEFYEFAQVNGIDSYDGMDVGPVTLSN